MQEPCSIWHGALCINLNQSKVTACWYAMGLSNDSQLQADAAPSIGRFDDPGTAVEQLVERRLTCKPVQQCIFGSTLLASFECCSPVCKQSITANTRKSRLTDGCFCRGQAPVKNCASSTTRVSRMTAKWSSEAWQYVSGSSRICFV